MSVLKFTEAIIFVFGISFDRQFRKCVCLLKFDESIYLFSVVGYKLQCTDDFIKSIFIELCLWHVFEMTWKCSLILSNYESRRMHDAEINVDITSNMTFPHMHVRESIAIEHKYWVSYKLFWNIFNKRWSQGKGKFNRFECKVKNSFDRKFEFLQMIKFQSNTYTVRYILIL